MCLSRFPFICSFYRSILRNENKLGPASWRADASTNALCQNSLFSPKFALRCGIAENHLTSHLHLIKKQKSSLYNASFFWNLTDKRTFNLTIKHCDKTKGKTISVKSSKNCQKTLKRDNVSTLTQRHFQVKMNEKKLFEYKYTKNKSLESKLKHY